MAWLRIPVRGVGARVATIDAYAFPTGVRQRFAGAHPSLSADDIRTVEAGTRQWFRLAARHPKAKLSMPSAVVDDLWHESLLHTQEYAQFCTTAFGHFLHHVPGSGVAGLRHTLVLAQQDEPAAPGHLPLLFRIDRELGIAGGRHYLADCGGRGDCYGLAGMVCLQHLDGPGRPPRPGWKGGAPPPLTDTGGGGVGCGGGCGGAG
jgi:hypothetical protein